MEHHLKAGLLAVGLDTYWDQFDGLLDRLIGYNNIIKNRMEEGGNVGVIDAGMVDSVDKAVKAVDMMNSSGIDILFIFVSTYALSSTIVPVATRTNVPVIMLNLQPTPAIDYARLNAMGDRGLMTGEWLANCQACSIPEFCSVFNRAGTRYDIVSGYLDDTEAWTEISRWLMAASVPLKARCFYTGPRLSTEAEITSLRLLPTRRFTQRMRAMKPVRPAFPSACWRREIMTAQRALA